MTRRRRIPKPRAKLELVPDPVPVEPVDPRREKHYHTHNPMREDGAMPHDGDEEQFTEYLILNGMTEPIYWLNVEAGEQQAIDIEENGIPIPTDKLTDDQKGWAKADHYDHFLKETARWRTVPDKESKVVPYRFATRLHDRDYRNHCDDGDNAKLIRWGYRWDMKELYQCQLCGEVIVKPFPAKQPDIEDNNHEDEHDDNGHDDVDTPGDSAA